VASVVLSTMEKTSLFPVGCGRAPKPKNASPERQGNFTAL
jgi:hypothetical protein